MAKRKNDLTSYAILASLSSEETLDYLQRNGMIDVDDVRDKMVDTERKQILLKHPYAISQGKDGRWGTWVADKTKKGGRKRLVKTYKEDLEEAIVKFYLENDEEIRRKVLTLRQLYPEWIEYKKLRCEETTIRRIDSDWKKYYENSPIVDKRIRDLTKLELDNWIHALIREHDFTQKMYVNVSLIIRQGLNYAVDLGIIEENLFNKVRVDGRRMFRKVRKKKDQTQVYSREEERKIFQEAWNDFEKSKRLVYRLGPLAVMFQFLTGVRVGELCTLKFSDIDGDMLTVCRMLQRDTGKVVEHTKNHEDREILLPNAAMEIVEVSSRYQREHNCKGEYIFSTNDKPLVYREVNVLLKKYCERLEIPYRSSHKLRKTYISSLIDAGVNINTIRSYAGHADEKTTYYNYCFDRAPDAEKKRLLEKALAS